MGAKKKKKKAASWPQKEIKVNIELLSDVQVARSWMKELCWCSRGNKQGERNLAGLGKC
jgi:hypothetical protein